MRVIGVHTDGGMRERILIAAKQLYKCEKLPPAQIPLVETLGVGIHAVGRANVQPGDRAMVVRRGAYRSFGHRILETCWIRRYRRGRKNAGAPGLRRASSRTEALLSVARGSQAGGAFHAGVRLHRRPRLHGSVDPPAATGREADFRRLINDKISLFDPDLHRREATILASRNSTVPEHHRVLELMESGADRRLGMADGFRAARSRWTRNSPSGCIVKRAW